MSDYMRGWGIGAMPPETGYNIMDAYKPKGLWSADMERGYLDGARARDEAEHAETARISKGEPK